MGVLTTFLTKSNMFGQKLLMSSNRKRRKEFTLNPRVMTDIKIFPTDETFTHLTRTVPMVEDIFHLIPRTTINFNLDRIGRKRLRRRTDVGCTKTIWTQVSNINPGIQELKAFRVIKLYSVGTGESSDDERSNKRRTELLTRKIQVNIFRRKQDRIINVLRVGLCQASVTNTKIIGHTM
jgi:hypothetical protein